MIETILDHWLALGPWVLGAAVMLSALGLPIPSTPLLIAAGASVRQGALGWMTLVLVWLGVVAGDCGSYWMGRAAGRWTMGKGQNAWLRVRSRFRREGTKVLLLTRFLLTSLDVPTNWVAGSGHYPSRRFLAVELAGRLVWVLLYGGLGFLTGSQWQQATQLADQLGISTGLILALAGGVFLLFRWLRSGRSSPNLVLEP